MFLDDLDKERTLNRNSRYNTPSFKIIVPKMDSYFYCQFTNITNIKNIIEQSFFTPVHYSYEIHMEFKLDYCLFPQ